MKRCVRGLLFPVRWLVRGLWALVKGCGHLMGMRRNTKVLDGAGYEVFVAKWLREQGFRQILHTGATGDFGVDLVAKKHGIYYAVQCKYYSSSVSGAAVQEAVAGMAYYHCDRAMVVTNSQLTRGARALAEANHVLVLEHVEPGKVTAAGIATPERIISVAVCTVLSVLLLPKIPTASATGWGVYVLGIILCYLIPRCILGLVEWFWNRALDRIGRQKAP